MSKSSSIATMDAEGRFWKQAISALPRITWGLFLLIIVIIASIAIGAETNVIFLVGAFVAVVLAWSFPYESFYVAAAGGLLLGLLVSVSTGDFQFGSRVFGGSIDVTVGELVAGAVIVAWALRMLLLWRGRRDMNWQPWLPLAIPFGALVVAHILSVFSPTHPDLLLVLKYALRPVALAYIISIALTVNFVRSRRRLKTLLSILALLGVFFAFDGFRSLFQFGLEFSFQRAQPLFQIFNLNPLGGNHNALAQMMLLGAPAALAYAALTKEREMKWLAWGAACFMGVIALLTFARSAWIAFASMLILLAFTIWNSWLREHKIKVIATLILLIPLAAYMIGFSLSDEVKGSTDARTVLSEIALFMFRESPVVGFGAGTFVQQVGNTYAYVVEFSTPRDSHGVIQKVAAETGSLGLLAFIWVLGSVYGYARRFWRKMHRAGDDARAYMYLAAAMLGAFVYQLFDTTYWTPRLWLPVGLVLAAGHIFSREHEERDPDFLNVSHG